MPEEKSRMFLWRWGPLPVCVVRVRGLCASSCRSPGAGACWPGRQALLVLPPRGGSHRARGCRGTGGAGHFPSQWGSVPVGPAEADANPSSALRTHQRGGTGLCPKEFKRTYVYKPTHTQKKGEQTIKGKEMGPEKMSRRATQKAMDLLNPKSKAAKQEPERGRSPSARPAGG